jgi:hypothetical protein
MRTVPASCTQVTIAECIATLLGALVVAHRNVLKDSRIIGMHLVHQRAAAKNTSNINIS